MAFPPFSPMFSLSFPPFAPPKPVLSLRLPRAPPGRHVAVGAPAVPREPENGEEDTNPGWHACFGAMEH